MQLIQLFFFAAVAFFNAFSCTFLPILARTTATATVTPKAVTEKYYTRQSLKIMTLT